MQHLARVIRALAHVNMVIGVNGFLRTKLAAQDLNGTVCNYLISVHVTLRAAPCLEYDQWEVVNKLA